MSTLNANLTTTNRFLRMTIDCADDSKFQIGPSIRIECRIGRTIRNRIGSRSFAGPYFVHTQFTSRATKFGRIIDTRKKVSNSE